MKLKSTMNKYILIGLAVILIVAREVWGTYMIDTSTPVSEAVSPKWEEFMDVSKKLLDLWTILQGYWFIRIFRIKI